MSHLIVFRLFCLVPGGTVSQEGEPPYKTDACIFNAPDEIDLQFMKNWEQVIINLMRRFKYLEKLFQVNLLRFKLNFQHAEVFRLVFTG